MQQKIKIVPDIKLQNSTASQSEIIFETGNHYKAITYTGNKSFLNVHAHKYIHMEHSSLQLAEQFIST